MYGSSRAGLAGTICVILCLGMVYFLRSPLTGVHKDTRSRWAAAVEVGASETRVHLYTWRGSASYHSLEILGEWADLVPIGLPSMNNLSHLEEIVRRVDRFVTAKVPEYIQHEAHIKFFLSSPGSGHRFDRHHASIPLANPNNSEKDRASIRVQIRDKLTAIANQQQHKIRIEAPVIDLPSADRCRYAWEAASYLLHHDDVRQPHIGMIDIGENNMHIAFYDPEEARVMVEYHKHYGLFEARRKFFEPPSDWSEGLGATNRDRDQRACDSGPMTGNRWTSCVAAVEKVFLKEKSREGCNSASRPCKLSQLQLPSLSTTKFVALRLFCSLLSIASIETRHVTLAQLASAGEKFCEPGRNITALKSKTEWSELYEEGLANTNSFSVHSAICFDFAYLTTVLHHGFEIAMTEDAFLFKDDSDHVVGKRDTIWLMGALIVGIRDVNISASTMGVDPAGTRIYLWTFQLMILVLFCFLIRQGCTVVLLKLQARRRERKAQSSTQMLDASNMDLEAAQAYLRSLQQVKNADAQGTKKNLRVAAAHQRSRSGENIGPNKAGMRMFDAQEVTLLRTSSTGSLPVSKPVKGHHTRSGSGDSSDSSTASKRVNINLGRVSGNNSEADY